jgi:septum formation protein
VALSRRLLNLECAFVLRPSGRDLDTTSKMKLILASRSPRRAEILRNAGITFEVCRTNVDEDVLPGEMARAMVARLAEAKARAAAAQAELNQKAASRIVVGADTTVELNGEILGKPSDAAHAREILGKLSGQTHHVLTGIFLLRFPDNQARAAIEDSAVTFSQLTERDIEDYVSTGEPFDKAGGYAIQGIAGRFISRIEGCYFNVVGLPLAKLYSLLLELGWPEN